MGVNVEMISAITARLGDIPNGVVFADEGDVILTGVTGVTIGLVLRVLGYQSILRTRDITSTLDGVDSTLVFVVDCYGDVTDGDYVTKCEEIKGIMQTNYSLDKMTETSKLMPVSIDYYWLSGDSLAKVAIKFNVFFHELWGTV